MVKILGQIAGTGGGRGEEKVIRERMGERRGGGEAEGERVASWGEARCARRGGVRQGEARNCYCHCCGGGLTALWLPWECGRARCGGFVGRLARRALGHIPRPNDPLRLKRGRGGMEVVGGWRLIEFLELGHFLPPITFRRPAIRHGAGRGSTELACAGGGRVRLPNERWRGVVRGGA